jgi:hypothetical protein
MQLATTPGVDEQYTVSTRNPGFFKNNIVGRKPADGVQANFHREAKARLVIDEEVFRARNELVWTDRQ